MTSSEAKERAADRIADVSRRGLDAVALWRECDEAMDAILPVLRGPCWFTLDPSTLLVTSHYNTAMPVLPPDYLTSDCVDDGGMSLCQIARLPAGAATVHETTKGDPSRSEAWRRYVQAFGAEQHLAVALRTRSGTSYGVVNLYREPGAAPFTQDDIAFMRAVSKHIATGTARGLLIGEAAEDGPNAPVLLVLDEEWQLQSMTPGAESMLGVLPGGEVWRTRGALPPVVLSVAGSAITLPDAADDRRSARVRTEDGRWVTLHGAPLLTGHRQRVAVIIERAAPDRISPLLMEAYGLSEREKEITRHVLRGDSTQEIASDLFLSPQTVQQHLRHVFEKTGVHSRRELVTKVFRVHYEPRVEDNHARVAAGRPVIGTPVRAGGPD
jgi:DNA-binding CsgD family transcriptional regulator/GAF domain-containing protein